MHYLRNNDKVWSPAHVIIWDTETRTIPNTEPEIEALRLWCATSIDRRDPKSGRARQAWGSGTTGEDLGAWIEEVTRGRDTTWMFAHNLGFDLSTTRLPMVLANLGWSITDAAVGGRAPWMRLSKGSKRLCLVDSGSYLNKPLADLAKLLGMTKPKLPKQNASSKAWNARCRWDVLILAAAMGQLLDWWDNEELGNFDITGAGTGWHAFRHIPAQQRTVIDPDETSIKWDRKAIYGGRRGTWRYGRISGGPFVELDFAGAYPAVAAHYPLPVRRGAWFESMDIDNWRVTSRRWGIIAEVEIESDAGLWPLKWGGQTWYPTGRFKTTLAGADIWKAAELGALRSIGRGQMHQLGYGMANWAEWCLDTQNNVSGDVPAMAQVAAKNWGRAVIGKWAARAHDKIELGPSPIAGWGYEEGFDHESQSRGGMVDIAGQRWWVAASGESDNSYPAILAFVEAYVRQELGDVIGSVGPGAIVSCDTDGLIIDSRRIGTAGSGGSLGTCAGVDPSDRLMRVIDQLNRRDSPLRIRAKGSARRAVVIGPQHIQGGALQRLAGISAQAIPTGPRSYTGRTWPGLQWQMTQGDSRGYARPVIESTIRGVHAPGWVTGSNAVIPPRAHVLPDGSTQLLPWGLMPANDQARGLAPEQNRRLPS